MTRMHAMCHVLEFKTVGIESTVHTRVKCNEVFIPGYWHWTLQHNLGMFTRTFKAVQLKMSLYSPVFLPGGSPTLIVLI